MKIYFFRRLALILLAIVVIGSVPVQARAATVVTFTTVGPTAWTVPAGVTSVQVLVVGGGGGGGSDMGGGGGGGGVIYNGAYAVTPGASVTVTIGGGGAGAAAGVSQARGVSGGNSVFDTLTAIGGGGGGSEYSSNAAPPASGGSGGGVAGGLYQTGGTGTAGQGNNGSSGGGTWYPGGGGGAGGTGSNQENGGPGRMYAITGTALYWGGGGGGSGYSSCGGNGGIGGGGGGAVCTTTGGAGINNGAAGGGGVISAQTNTPGGNGGANTGGGGGGGSHYNSNNKGGNGGSGIVVVSYGAPSITLSQSTTITGSASVLGTISKGSGTFVIDDPLDPKNKLLYHSFVESPDVMNIYDGIAQLDSGGSATITLPDYFLALNKDFRYLATPVGQSMPNLYISSEVHRRFWIFRQIIMKVSGGAAGGRVSWQVTGIRHDPFIVANPIIPEVDKGPGQLVDKGTYLFPEFYKK